jgi:hypothetical protein
LIGVEQPSKEDSRTSIKALLWRHPVAIWSANQDELIEMGHADEVDAEVNNTASEPAPAGVDQQQGSSGGDLKKEVPGWKQKPIYNYNGDDEPPLTNGQKMRIAFWFLVSIAATVGVVVGSWYLFYWIIDRREELGKSTPDPIIGDER